MKSGQERKRMDLKSQLDNLRSSLAHGKQTAAGSERDINQFVAGTAISNSCGSCFQSNTEYPENHRQGDVSIVQFKNMDPCILHVLGKDARLSSVPTDRLLFLDTETTGIAGGTGTVA